MKRTVTAVGAVLGAIGILTTTTAAHAQAQGPEFGQRGEFIIGVDRLIPFVSYAHASADFTAGGTKTTGSISQWSMSWFYGSSQAVPDPASLAGATVGGAGGVNSEIYPVPRLGFDYAVANNVTVGGDLILFYTMGGDFTVKVENGGSTGSTSSGIPGTVIFGVSPRAGYILHMSNLLSFWLRGGLSFVTQHTSSSTTQGGTTTTDSSSFDQFSIDLEPQLVLTPMPHVGITAAVDLDIPFGGSWSAEEDVNNGSMQTTTKASGGASILYLSLVTIGAFVHF